MHRPAASTTPARMPSRAGSSSGGPFDQTKVTESIARSYYDYSGGKEEVRHPWNGETKPNYTGPTPPFEELTTDAEYSWLKAPRYDGKVMEVGALARVLVAYASGSA